jgi:hypothetical protein
MFNDTLATLGALLSLLILSVPGIFYAARLRDRLKLDRTASIAAVISITLLICLAIYTAFLFSPLAGNIARSIGLFAGVVFGFGLYKQRDIPFKRILTYPPLALMLLIFALYSSAASTCTLVRESHTNLAQSTCVTHDLPADNELPLFYAYSHAADKNMTFGDWKETDRPPLQTALVLINPMMDTATYTANYNWYFFYAIILQLLWVVAVWELFAAAKINRRAAAILIMAFSTTGFFYINSVFAWPKLLSGSLFILGLLVLLSCTYKKTVGRDGIYKVAIGTVCIGLAILAHSGSLFTLIPLLVLLLLRRHFKTLLILVGVLALMMAPWQVYKYSQDGGRDRLLKWHFAGVADSLDTRSTVTTVIDSYKQTSLQAFIESKLANIKTLFVRDDQLGAATNQELIRKQIFYSTFVSIGVFSVGFMIAIFRREKFNNPLLRDAVFVCFGGLVVWIVTMFEPGGTTIHQGSYATMLLLFFIPSVFIAIYRSLLYSVLLFSIVSFATLWVLTIEGSGALYSPWLLGVSGALLTLMAFVVIITHRNQLKRLK